MDFKQLEAFMAVVKYKNFSRAADALYLTQPTISSHILALEHELHVSLFLRRSTEATLTEAGKNLYSYASRIMNLREQAISSLQESKKLTLFGTLSLSVSSVIGEVWLPRFLSGFHRAHPRIHFLVDQSDSDNVEQVVLSNHTDLGLLGKRPNPALASRVLFTDRMVLITPKTEAFQSRHERSDSLALDDILEEEYIWRESGSATRNRFEQELKKKGRLNKLPHFTALMSNIEGIKSAVEEGLGVSVISELAALAHSHNRSYLIFHFQDLELSRQFYLVWNKNIPLSPLAEAFRDFVLEEL